MTIYVHYQGSVLVVQGDQDHSAMLQNVMLIHYSDHIMLIGLRDKRCQHTGGQRGRTKTNTGPGAHHISKISGNLVVW